jgi:hypothetical protein
MGFLDDAKSKLTKADDDHGDKISAGIDKKNGGTDDDLPASRTQGQQGLTQSGPPSDPTAPTG